MTDIIIPRKSDLKKLPKAEQKSNVRRNKHFLRWIKENCCCKQCGERPPVEGLTFHHVTERRAGGTVISQLQTTTAMINELLKGEFLCRRCHDFKHRNLFPPEKIHSDRLR